MGQSTVDTVRLFYQAIHDGDAEAIEAVIDRSFTQAAAIVWPPSLPHGGRIVGARKLRGLFAAITKPGSTAPGPTNLTLVQTIGEGDEVVAWISFDWSDPSSGTTIPNSALELWRFTDGKVTEILAHYWDHTSPAQPQNA